MNRTVLIIIVVFSVLCLVLCGLIWLGGAKLINWIEQGNEGLAFRVEAPLQVEAGAPVEILVSVENNTADEGLLQSIDISLDYLEGIAVESSQPMFSQSSLLEFGPEMRSYAFLRPVPAGGVEQVTFSGIAVKEGDFSGEVQVCMGMIPVCDTFVIRTIVGSGD
jgi:hypothetical protein